MINDNSTLTKLYSPFGQQSTVSSGKTTHLRSTLNTDQFGYTGQVYNTPAQLMMMGGYRAYQPTTQTFLKQDSFSPFQNEKTFNGFDYAAGNPLLYTDPTGHMSAMDWFTIALGIAVVGVGIATAGVGYFAGAPAVTAEAAAEGGAAAGGAAEGGAGGAETLTKGWQGAKLALKQLATRMQKPLGINLLLSGFSSSIGTAVAAGQGKAPSMMGAIEGMVGGLAATFVTGGVLGSITSNPAANFWIPQAMGAGASFAIGYFSSQTAPSAPTPPPYQPPVQPPYQPNGSQAWDSGAYQQ